MADPLLPVASTSRTTEETKINAEIHTRQGQNTAEGSEVVLEGVGGFIWGIEEGNTGVWGKAISIEMNSKFGGLVYRLDTGRIAKSSTRGVK
jgi:hypothetical protein